MKEIGFFDFFFLCQIINIHSLFVMEISSHPIRINNQNYEIFLSNVHIKHITFKVEEDIEINLKSKIVKNIMLIFGVI